MLLVEIGENKMLLACHDNLVSKLYLFYLHDFISFFRMKKLSNAHTQSTCTFMLSLQCNFIVKMSKENLEAYFFSDLFTDSSLSSHVKNERSWTLIKGKKYVLDDTYITYHARGWPRRLVDANWMLYVKISPYANYCHLKHLGLPTSSANKNKLNRRLS